MHAVVVGEPGGPETMSWQAVADPVPQQGEVLIDVVASGVNRADLMQRQGHYPPPPGASPYLGLECSGTVATLGDGGSGWSVGTEVCALLSGGGYAEQVTVPAGQLLPVPTGVSLQEAAALPEVACTVWSNVVMFGRLGAGDTLLVHGGASGIGTFAIQLGVALGARVCCTAGSPAKLDRCRELGADVVINYKDEDFVERVRKGTNGRGADVVLDNMGAKYLARNVDVLAPDGRLAIIGLQGGRTAELDIAAVLGKRLQIAAMSLRSRPAGQKAEIVAAVREHVWPLVADGRIRPVVEQVLPMSRAADAHRAMDADEHVGKVLLTTG